MRIFIEEYCVAVDWNRGSCSHRWMFAFWAMLSLPARTPVRTPTSDPRTP